MESSTFVRKAFYSDPPAKGATPAEWAEWADKDDRQAAADKAAYTKGLDHAVGGAFDQADIYAASEGCTPHAPTAGGGTGQSVPIAFVGGDVEAGIAPDIDLPQAASQDSDYDRRKVAQDLESKRNKGGGRRSATLDRHGRVVKESKSARRRANQKARKAAGK